MSEPSSLASVFAGVRRHLRRAAGAAIGLWTLAVTGSVLVLAWLLAGVEGWRPGTPVPLVLVLVGAAVLAALFGWTLLRLRRWTRDPHLAGEIERIVRLPDGSVRAQVELARALPEGVSESLVREGERVLLGRLNAGPADLAGTPGRRLGRFLRLAGGGAVLVGALAALLWTLSPERAQTAWAGLVRPAALLEPDPLPPLDVEPGDATLPRGDPPALDVSAGPRDSVRVHWRAAGEVLREQAVPVSEGRASAELPPLDAETRYWVSAPDGARTREHVLRPGDPSLLSDVTVEATYPPHTGLSDESFRGVPDSLQVPAGTELAFGGAIVGEGGTVVLEGEEGPVARFPVEDARFSGSWRPEASTSVEWEVEGGEAGGLLPPAFAVEVVADRPPEVSLPVPGEHRDLPSSLRMPAVVEATDDYGVAWIEVETVLRTAEGEEEPPVVDRIATDDRRGVTLRPTLDFSEWDLRPGDEVLLRARAADNAPQPQVTESPTYRLRMPAAATLREDARSRMEASTERASELLERAEEEAAQVREAEQGRSGAGGGQGAGDGAGGFEEREEMRELLERQADLVDELDRLRDDVRDAGAGLGGDDPANEALRERIRELDRSMEDLVAPETRERMDELLEAFQEGEMPEPAEQVLDEIGERQDDLREELERALERLERSVLEESFHGAEEELRSLVTEQEEVAEELAEGADGGRQSEIADATRDTEEQVSALEDRLREAGESGAGDRAADAATELDEAGEAMERAAEAADQGGGEEAAGGEAGDAAEALEGALQELEEARAEWSDEWLDSMRDALRRSAQDALSLAREQAALRSAIEAAGRSGWDRYELEQVALGQGLGNLSAELEDGLRQVPAAGRQVSEAVEAALEGVERTTEELRDRVSVRPEPGVHAERVHEQLNQVAVLVLLVLEEMGADPPPEGDAEQVQEELSALASEQEALNEEAQAFAEDPEGDGAVQESGELALAQEAIAGALRDLANQPGGGETTADLDELAEEGEEIAEDLTEERLDATTLERQDFFLERLLSAGRTLERDDPMEEREGTTAGETERRAVSPLSDTLLEGLSVPGPAAEALEGLAPGQRRLVLDYFDRINRREAGGGEP